MGPAGTDSCGVSLSIAIDTCHSLGVPVALEKLEGPPTTLTFLGLQLDTVRGQLSLPEEKLSRLQIELESWTVRKSCTKRELRSLIGSLQHAAAVVQPGRPFVRRLIELMKIARREDFKLRLNVAARSDIIWWHTFLRTWNGVGILPILQRQVQLTLDASGSWGCGVYSGVRWFQLVTSPYMASSTKLKAS